jgi:uncharacterized membrane protein YfcA
VDTDKYEYTRTLLVFGNVAILLWTITATIALWFYNQAAAWIFPLLTAAIIYVFLRRIGCNTCAYCKTCTMGFGRISAWFFGKRQLKDLNNKTALAFVAIIYVLLALIPEAFLTISTFQEFTTLKITLLSCLLLISIYSATTWLKPRQQKPEA